MWRIATPLTLLLIFAMLVVSACIALRTMGPAVEVSGRTPEILLAGPYDPPEKGAEPFLTTSDYLRDLQILVDAGPTQILSTSDILRGVYLVNERTQP